MKAVPVPEEYTRMEDIRFPYEMRVGQRDIIDFIVDAMERKVHAVFEAGTGTGKTVTALSALLHYAVRKNKRIIYLTRTNSQQDQVITEIRALASFYPDELLGISIQGRGNMCSMTEVNSEFEDASSEEIGLLCRAYKKAALEVEKCTDPKVCCPFIKPTREADFKKIKAWFSEVLPSAEEAVSQIKDMGLCPYEVMKRIMPEARVVAAPYIYILDPSIRDAFLNWMHADVRSVVIVFDEAHNLPDYTRELASGELSVAAVSRAQAEAKRFNIRVAGDLKVEDILVTLKDALFYMRDNFLMDEDGFIPPDELEYFMMKTLGTQSVAIKRSANDLIAMGEGIKEQKLKEKKLPRSYLFSVGSFLKFWLDTNTGPFIKLVHARGKEDDNPKLELYCLDPSIILDELWPYTLSTHMSGTLAPLKEYTNVIGLPVTTEAMVFPSPFPAKNRKVTYVTDVTTRYETIMSDSKMISKLQKRIMEVISGAWNHNTLCLFPSYDMLKRIVDDKMVDRIHNSRGLYMDFAGVKQADIMDMVGKFRNAENAVMLSVMGGRLSEGMDFPDRALEVLAIVGIPYPKPTTKQRALERYLDSRFGNGWEYTVKNPTSRKIQQALGRLIRKETDRGFAIILDSRAVQFKKDIPDLEEVTDIKQAISHFFGT